MRVSMDWLLHCHAFHALLSLVLCVEYESTVRVGYFYDPADTRQAKAAEFAETTARYVYNGMRQADSKTAHRPIYNGFALSTDIRLISASANDSLCEFISAWQLQYLFSTVHLRAHVRLLEEASIASGIPTVHITDLNGLRETSIEPATHHNHIHVLHPLSYLILAGEALIQKRWGHDRIAMIDQWDGNASDRSGTVTIQGHMIKQRQRVQTAPTGMHGAQELSQKSQIQLQSMLESAMQREFDAVVIGTNTAVAEAVLEKLTNHDEKQRHKQHRHKLEYYFATADTTPLMCDACPYVDLLWLRPHPTVRPNNPAENKLLALKKVVDWYVRQNDFLSMEDQVIEALYSEVLDMIWFDSFRCGNTSCMWNGTVVQKNTVYNCSERREVDRPFRLALLQHQKNTKPPTYGNLLPLGGVERNVFYQDLIIRVVKFQEMDHSKAIRKSLPYVDHVSEDEKTRHPQFTYVPDSVNKGWYYRGLCIDLIEKMRTIQDNATVPVSHLFSYHLYSSPDGTFGTMDYRDEWTGMVQEIITGEAEIILAPLSITAERENFIDYTVPYYDLVGMQMMMRESLVETNLFRFLQVLEVEVWACIVGAYFVTVILLYAFERLSPYSYSNNRDKYRDDAHHRIFTVKECLWFCLTSLTPQGGGEAPKNVSGRMVAATWWLFGFIIVASYTANLAAYLTMNKSSETVQEVTDLVGQYLMDYSILAGGTSETYFQRMRDIESDFYKIWESKSLNTSMSPKERARLSVWEYPISQLYTKLWRNMEETGLAVNYREALDRVLQSGVNGTKKFALIGESDSLRFAADLEYCNLKVFGKEFSKKAFALAVQQKSDLRNTLTKRILDIQQDDNRTLEQIKRLWWDPKTNPRSKQHRCSKLQDKAGISVWNIGGVFILTTAGLFLAIFILMFEFLVAPSPPFNRKKKGKKRKGSTATISTTST